MNIADRFMSWLNRVSGEEQPQPTKENTMSIPHSDLARALANLRELQEKAIQNILQITTSGVIAEGGELPEAHADSLQGRNQDRDAPSKATDSVRLPAEVFLPAQSPVKTVETKSVFRFGKSSEKELFGVRPELVNVARIALSLSNQDFTVFEGLRTLDEQVKHVQNGTSKTMNSMHLKQADGFGWALDLVPWIDGKPKWDWEGCYEICAAMTAAAKQAGLASRIRWGGTWDRRLADLPSTAAAIKKEVEAYTIRHEGADFLDGPHFEWCK